VRNSLSVNIEHTEKVLLVLACLSPEQRMDVTAYDAAIKDADGLLG